MLHNASPHHVPHPSSSRPQTADSDNLTDQDLNASPRKDSHHLDVLKDELPEQEVKGLDGLLDRLGAGKWTMYCSVVVAIWYGFLSFQAMAGAFMAPHVNHTCMATSGVHPLSPDLPHDLGLPSSTSGALTVNEFPAANITGLVHEAIDVVAVDTCSYYVNTSAGVMEESCTQWNFDNSTFTTTVTSEMELVCGKSVLAPLYQSVYMFGSVIGSPVGGHLSDKYGRGWLFKMAVVIYALIATGLSWAPNISSVLTARFFLGAMHMISLQAGFVLVMESCSSHLRPVLGIMVALPWALGIALYGVFGYFVREWRNLQLLISLPGILIFPAIWFLDESPRWLIVKGYHDQARTVLARAARWKGESLPSALVLEKIMSDLYVQSEEEDEAASRWSVKHRLQQWLLKNVFIIVRTRHLRTMTLTLCLDFFTVSLVYYGLALGAVNLSVNPYFYMLLSGMMEIPPYLLMGPLLARLGRKAPAIVSFLITGLVLLGLPFIPPDMIWVKMTLALTGKFFITAVFEELFLYSSEIFPTEVRNQGLGLGLLASRLGSIVSPFINDVLAPVVPWSTYVVFASLSLGASAATCLLPETKGSKMPDLVSSMENQTTVSVPSDKPAC
ncbi:organic cation transporter protein-like isoform X2 [Homarus americanus]|uniref:organic cation transporter protein-like isoform X2 n=1 Tax=Homarus americanus TaxID=6706 RepID=UPI001C48E387|nr:organic cation transporter protein-like isoform X2 [Homarus americanus]